MKKIIWSCLAISHLLVSSLWAAENQSVQTNPSYSVSGHGTEDTIPERMGPENLKVVYDPPQPKDAPDQIRNSVMLGYNILIKTQKYAADYVGNALNCHNCHFEGGITKGGKNGGISYVGVAAKYPHYRERHDYAVDLMTRINNCFMRSLKGKPLSGESKEMTALLTYYQWISKGIPIYAEVPWLGLQKLESDHKPVKEAGKKIYGEICAKCHGENGQGGEKSTSQNHRMSGPPLWGNDSFTDGASMSKSEVMAAFAYNNMPKGNPNLTKEQALDAASYVTNQPRPQYAKDNNAW
jgi:thiosulfate dehydrogenase